MEIRNVLNRNIGDFLNRNREYMCEAYIRNSMDDSIIGQLYITSDRIFKADDERCTLGWGTGCDVLLNRLVIRYKDVTDCHEEIDEYGSQTICILMKCGMSIDIECVGMKI